MTIGFHNQQIKSLENSINVQLKANYIYTLFRTYPMFCLDWMFGTFPLSILNVIKGPKILLLLIVQVYVTNASQNLEIIINEFSDNLFHLFTIF